MNFCPKCGAQIEEGALFCPKCGFNLQARVVPGTTTGEPVQAVPQAITTVPPLSRTTAGNPDGNYQSNLGFIGATKQYFVNYVNFSGRMSRANYWWSYLAAVLIALVAGILTYATGSYVPYYFEGIALLLPNLTSLVRRLHDSNHSGWACLWGLIPIIGSIYVLVLLLKAGDQTANRFG